MEQLIRSRRKERRGGFTLIETMIAMTILGGGLLAVAGMQLAALQYGGRGRHQTVAANIAQEKMEFLNGIPWDDAAFVPNATWTAPDTVNHIVNDGNNRVEHSYEVTYRIDDLVAGLTRTIDVRVAWDEVNRPGREYAISGVRFNF